MIDHSAHASQPLPTEKNSPRGGLFVSARWIRILVLGLACMLALVFRVPAQELSNGSLTLRLNVTPEGIPVISQAVWQETGQVVFRDLGTPDGLGAWVPASLIPTTQTVPTAWNIIDGETFTTAEATRELANKMSLTWIIDLPKQGQLFRLRIRLTNGGKKARSVNWFPAWSASWDVGGQSQWARWWQSIEYNRIEQTLSADAQIRLGSRLHSSDDAAGGVNPYWVVGGPAGRVYFGLQWSGGWSARLKGLDNGFTFSVNLPAEETQLVLNRRETVEGPALLVTPVAGADEPDSRVLWMRQRQALGQHLYGGPSPSFPLSYNSWYAARRSVNADFLDRQIAAMSPYGFAAFVVDAGWFAEGRWKPDRAKFPGGTLNDILAALKSKGVQAGLWSTPQYVSDSNNSSDLALEQPPVFNRFLGGYLVDLSSSGFADYLADHVQALRNKYSVDYWKYDQPFFTEESTAGQMRNVIGLQNGLQAVRQTNPDLTIENCFNGGRMINDFTLLATQTSWLKDAGTEGRPDPQANITSALNALEFVFPWAALRSTINFDQLDQNDDEMTRLYCRSAMAGRWGISSDLSLVSERQRAVILKEIENYRRLNHLKYSCLYDLQLPTDSAEVAGVTFYTSRRLHAGVILYRWRRDGAFDQRVLLAKLKPGMMYHVVDVDTGAETTASGADLMSNGVTVAFSGARLSALLLVEPATQTPTP
jgi:predicted ribosome-associated RNA-binding protein Tma20